MTLEKMMTYELERAKQKLFDENTLGTVNIKLFRGSDRNATPEEFAEQINRSLTQIEAGDFELVDAD
jgi:hypothetical protein